MSRGLPGPYEKGVAEFEAVVVEGVPGKAQKLRGLQSTEDAEGLQALDCHRGRFGILSDLQKHSEFVEWQVQQSGQEYGKN